MTTTRDQHWVLVAAFASEVNDGDPFKWKNLVNYET